MNESTRYVARGIRNCNPLNIRIGNKWKGEVEHPTDKDFEQFVDMFHGLRAGFILLRRYIERYHLCTLVDIIYRWAPPCENSSGEYCKYVAGLMGIGILDTLDWKDKKMMCLLVWAMCRVESGVCLELSLISSAYDDAACV